MEVMDEVGLVQLIIWFSPQKNTKIGTDGQQTVRGNQPCTKFCNISVFASRFEVNTFVRMRKITHRLLHIFATDFIPGDVDVFLVQFHEDGVQIVPRGSQTLREKIFHVPVFPVRKKETDRKNAQNRCQNGVAHPEKSGYLHAAVQKSINEQDINGKKRRGHRIVGIGKSKSSEEGDQK